MEHRPSSKEIKEKLLSGLRLHTVRPDQPSILRVDASNRAIGAGLEQVNDETHETPTIEGVRTWKRVPVAFCSRKLTPGQLQWTPREKETDVVVLARSKWAFWIGIHPVLVLTNHKTLQ